MGSFAGRRTYHIDIADPVAERAGACELFSLLSGKFTGILRQLKPSFGPNLQKTGDFDRVAADSEQGKFASLQGLPVARGKGPI